jgi:hypothetical protein
MRRSLARSLSLSLALSLGAAAGCQSAGTGFLQKKPCADCTNGTCERHAAKEEGATTPGQSPFAPFPAGK